MAFGSAPAIDFNYFLARKYALQGQEADATTSNAASTATQANANAQVAGTVAAQNRVQTALLPGQAAAQSALQRAQAALYGTQASVLPAVTAAQIAQTQAETHLTGTNDAIASYDGGLLRRSNGTYGVIPQIDLAPQLPRAPGPALSRTFGAQGYQGYRLDDPAVTRGVRVFRGG